MINDLKKKFQMVFERVGDPLLLVDRSGFIVDFNPAARAALHIGDSELIDDVISLEKNFVLDPEQIHALLGRPDSVCGVRLNDDEGNLADVVMDVVNLDAIKTKKALKLIHIKDFSSFQNYERWKDELISMVSHEIKNPLAAMKNSMNLLISQASGPVNLDQDKLLTTSIRGIDRLTRLLDGFLDMSRIGAGKYTMDPHWVDVHAFVPDVVESFRTLFNVHRQALDVVVSDELDKIFVDGAKLEQILINLLSNSVKFTPQGGRICVTVEPASLEALDDELRVLPWWEITDLRFIRIGVKDSGIGMAGETISNVFTRYYATAGGGGLKGSHLGLSISKTLTEAQFGSLQIDSEPGVGTEATVYLPGDEHTTLVLSRMKSLERCLARVVDARREALLFLIRRDRETRWLDDVDLFAKTPLVNPSLDTEKTGGLLMWTLSDAFAVVLATDDRHVDAIIGDENAELSVGVCRVSEDGTRVAQLLKQALHRLKQPRAVPGRV
jgi:signal transduction histidine kinase